MKGSIWAVAVVALALALAPAFLNGAYADAAAQKNATETATVDFSNNYSVQAEHVFQYNDSINVTDIEDGDNLNEGQDYTWNDSSGVVGWINSSTMTEGNTTRIEYNYTQHAENTRTIEPIMSANVAWIGLLLMLVGIGALLQLVFGGGGF